MKRYRPAVFLGLVAGLVLLTGCAAHIQLEKRARGEYIRGEYDAAVCDAAASLRHKPDFQKAQYLLQDAFRVAVSRHEDGIAEARRAAGKFHWDNIAAHYAGLVNISRTVRDLPFLPNPAMPGGGVRIEPADYSGLLTEANAAAAEAHYQEGNRLAASSPDIEVQRQATQEFSTADRFVSGYKDAAERSAATHKAATRRLAVVPFEDKSGTLVQYGALTDKIADDITSSIMQDPAATEFLAIVTRDQLELVMSEQQLQVSGIVDPATAVRLGKLLGVHDILTGRITQVLYSPPATTQRTVQQEAEVVVRTLTSKDSLGVEQTVEVKGKVNATVTIFTKTASMLLSGSYSIINVGTATVEKTESCEGRRDFSDEWATYTGDKRALGDYAGLCEKGEPTAPTAAQLAYDAATSFGGTLAASVKAFLR